MNKDKMELEEAIKQLKDLVIDRESFIQNDSDHDDIFLKDKKAIEIVLQALKDYNYGLERYMNGEFFSAKQMKFIYKEYIPKKKIEDKIKQLKNAQQNVGIDRWKAIYQYQKEILQELLED